MRKLYDEENIAKENLENAKLSSDGSGKPVDAEEVRRKIKQLDEEINQLKEKR